MVSDRTVYTRLKADVSDFQRGMLAASASAKAFTSELNTSTDRTANLTQGLLAIGPATVPILGAAVPAVSALTNQLAFAAAGAGVAALAFSGIGDALKATNDYAIEPTSANLDKMQQSLSELGPAGREFVAFLQEVRPEMQGLQDAAQEGLFPGAEEGIRDLMTLMPQVERIISEIAGASGDLLAEAGENLASPRWSEFFDFIEAEARPALENFGRTVGNLGEGFANLWMAFDPVSDDFAAGFLRMSQDFAKWTDGLSETQGFQEFLDYIERTGPKVWDTLGALGNAFLQIVEAAAPVGEAALPAIEAVADSIAAIAGSDVGPAVVGIVALTSAYSRLIAVSKTANSSAIGGLFSRSAYAGTAAAVKDLPRAFLNFDAAAGRAQASVGQLASSTGRLGSALRGTAKLAGGAGGLAFVLSDLDNKAGLSNTSMLGLAGSMAGPWGAAVGAGVGLAMDFAAANDDIWTAVDRANKAINDGTAPIEQQKQALDEAREKIDEFAASADGALSRFSLAGLKNGFEDLFGRSDVEEARDALDDAAEVYEQNREAAQNARLAEAGLGDALRDTTADTREQVDAVLQLIQARNDLANETLTALDAELNYEAAIDAAAEAAAKGKDGLDSNTEAGRENLGLLGDLAGAWNDLSPAQQNAEGASRRARKSFIDAAVGMGASKEEAKALADELLEIPSNVSTRVSLKGASAATVEAEALTTALRNIPGLTEATIRTIKETYIAPTKSDPKPSLEDMLRPYTGLRMPEGYAMGGKVPGTPPLDPTEDNVLAMGANTRRPLMVRSGEWIINEPQSDKNDRWLRAINNGLNLDDLFGRMTIPGFAAGGRYDRYQELEYSTKLDIERQKLRIQEIDRSLDERETVKRGGKKERRDVLRGRARKVAELELREAKRELAEMLRENRELKNYGTSAEEERANEAVEAAEQVVRDAADRFTSTKASAASLFEIGSSTSAAAVDRNLTQLLGNSKTFLGLLGDLKSKGASPWLLGELVKAGPTGGAIRLAREYNNDSAKLASVNGLGSQIDQYTNAYAGLVGNSAFMAPAAWNSGVSSATHAGVPDQTIVDGSQVIGYFRDIGTQQARIEIANTVGTDAGVRYA
jgi:hypothetical protein